MKYCLRNRTSAEYLAKADEIRIDTRDYKSTPDLIEKYAGKTFILELFRKDDINWDELRRWNILSKNHLILCLDSISDIQRAKELNIKYYMGYPVGTMFEATALEIMGVCYMNVGMPLFFNKALLETINVPKRCVINVAYSDGLWRDNGVCGQWVRPEDQDLYSHIDVFEFAYIPVEKEQALYRIYAEQKEWPGDLGYIIENLNYFGENRMIGSEVTQARLHCRQKCQEEKAPCRICYRALDLANSARVKEYLDSEKIFS